MGTTWGRCWPLHVGRLFAVGAMHKSFRLPLHPDGKRRYDLGDISIACTSHIQGGGHAMAAVNDFFTLQSLGTFAGASGATLLIGNAIQYVFNVNPRWLALAVAEFVCLGVVAVGQIDGVSAVAVTPFFVAFVNGFLVFCSAVGLTEMGAGARDRTRRPGGAETMMRRTLEHESGGGRRGFWQPWF